MHTYPLDIGSWKMRRTWRQIGSPLEMASRAWHGREVPERDMRVDRYPEKRVNLTWNMNDYE